MSACGFHHVKTGDYVLRLLAGDIPMRLEVMRVEDGIIHTRGGWTFLAATGGEIDEACGWDGYHTGSVLVCPCGLCPHGNTIPDPDCGCGV